MQTDRFKGKKTQTLKKPFYYAIERKNVPWCCLKKAEELITIK